MCMYGLIPVAAPPFLHSQTELRCVDVTSKRVRRIVTKLRGGTAELILEIGRWCGLKREA